MKNATEEKTIVMSAEQIEEARNLSNILADALGNESNDKIMEAMAEIGKAYRRIIRPASETQVTIREDGTKLVGAVTTIVCEECGKEHVVKVQDAGQVKRCPACQKTFRNAKRAEKRKEKRAEVRAEKEADAVLAAQLLAQFKAEKEQQPEQ